MKRRCIRGHGFLVSGQRCRACERERTARRDLSHYENAEYRARRAAVLAAEPWCHSTPCRYDDAGTVANPLTADHVVAVASGGALGPLSVLCKRCNSGKRDR